MEGKIVAAVMGTLAIVFAGMSGGSVSEIDQVLPDNDSPINDFTSSFELMDRIFDLPEPENEATITLTLEESQQFNLQAERLEIQGLRELEGTTSIQSEEDIGLRGFTGNVMPENVSEVMGSAEGFYTDQISTNSTIPVNLELETEEILAENTSRTEFNLEVEEINLQSGNGTEISETSTEVEITSFQGDVEFRPKQMEITLEGKVDQVNAGSASFGS